MRRSLSLLFISLSLSLAAFAQSDSATLSGRVTDATGAVLGGADVTVASIDTGAVNTLKTNDAGVYNFSSLRPGKYRVTVRAAGFRQSVHDGLVLHVQDRIKEDFALQVGSAEQTVTVTGEAPLVNTESAAVGTVV